jgi:ATP-dependent protease ClpP protease subunit
MDPQEDGPHEIALVGDLTDNENEITDKLLSVEPGGELTMFIDSPGGSPYCALSLMSLILLRGLKVTGVVTGECSSAALWPFAACQRRVVTPFSVLLFHPMKWQSEEHVGLAEAAEWARHFGQLEKDMDKLLADLFGVSTADMDKWINPGRYVSGGELVAAGLAEMADLKSFRLFERNGVARESQKRNRAQPVREERPKRPTAAVNPQRGRT